MTAATRYRLSNPPPRGLGTGTMPARFTDPSQEVAACRNGAAVFDYSFLLRLVVRGAGGERGLAALCGRDFGDLPPGRIRYALTADAEGWLVSDLTVWRMDTDCLEVMSGRAEDAHAITQALAPYDATVSDMSDHTSVLAVQGPATDEVLDRLGGGSVASDIPFFGFRDAGLGGVPCTIARLGFTGLDGVEIVCSADRAQALWDALTPHAPPAGFEAADRLRLSAGLALFCQEFKPPVSAADAGLSRFRPRGGAPQDLRPARVVRLCFSARPAGSWAQGVAAGPPPGGDGGVTFPPPPGCIAVTSLAPCAAPERVIGMGYATPHSPVEALQDTAGKVEDIRVNREPRDLKRGR